MPVFIIMYNLLRGLTDRPGGLGSGVGQTVGLAQVGETPTRWLFTEQNFTPAHLNPTTELYQALNRTSEMKFLGMDLSLSAADAMAKGLVIALPFLGLLVVMLLTGLYQNRQLQARNTSGNVNPQQQMIMKVMPFFLPIFSYGFPAGLALYWCTQNFCRIGTNAYITRSIYKKEHAGETPVETTASERSSTGSDKPKVKPTGPGKSAKSQAAHRKTSGTSATGGTTSSSAASAPGTRRRSGERRSGSPTSKDR
jgi:YidC/Oxa1 family membrane protein insertase